MKITKDNYFEITAKADMSVLPKEMQEGHKLMIEGTDNGKNFDIFDDETFSKVMHGYFAGLKKLLKPGPNKAKKHSIEPIITKTKPSQKTKAIQRLDPEEGYTMWVERMPDELRFIKRYVLLDGKVKTREQLLSFLSSLQKAILEKRIRKTSDYAEEIEYVQNSLILLLEKSKSSVRVTIDQERLRKLKLVLTHQTVMSSVPLIKRYISLNGKQGVKDKAAALINQIERSIDNGKIEPNDVYFKKLTHILVTLKSFVANRSAKHLQITKSELNGLEGILDADMQAELDGLTDSDEPKIMNSQEFADVQFTTIGLKDKWRELIGDPAPGFTVMVFGKPKMGKSFLCVDFAGYLARNHGHVLYVAKEEGLDATLQLKIRSKDVAHPNLHISDGLPKDLSPYDFIFLDSVTKLRLTPDDLEWLEKENPGKSFVYIFQTTKQGLFKGANSFQHEVDAVIEIPERGIAIQNGRFNQGGQMKIFNKNGGALTKKAA